MSKTLDEQVEEMKAREARKAQDRLDQQRENAGANEPMPWEQPLVTDLDAYKRRQRSPEEVAAERQHQEDEKRRAAARRVARERSALVKLGLPGKEASFIMEGLDRWGRKRNLELESWRRLWGALTSKPRPGTVVMSGLPGTGKSSSAALALHRLARVEKSWGVHFGGARYIRAAHLASVPRESDQERDLLKAWLLVIDDLGDEGSKDWIPERLSHFISDRDDNMEPGAVTIITGNLGTKGEGLAKISNRYGDRMLERLAECGLAWLYSAEITRPR
jgi:DNA replication protein DnaC